MAYTQPVSWHIWHILNQSHGNKSHGIFSISLMAYILIQSHGIYSTSLMAYTQLVSWHILNQSHGIYSSRRICHETYAMRLVEYMLWDWLSICHEATRVYAMRLIDYVPWDWLSICHETTRVYAMSYTRAYLGVLYGKKGSKNTIS